MGLAFRGRVGLAAGFDRHGVLGGKADRLGLGSIEIGTLVIDAPRPFAARIPQAGAAAARCGVSIGKRAATPWARAEDDYVRALLAFHPRADYVTLNPGRDRPPAARFVRLTEALAQARDRVVAQRGRRLPLVVKLPSAWLAERDRVRIAAAFVAAGADGLLVSAEGAGSRLAARAVLAELAQSLGRDTCVISVGGIDSVREAQARLRAGAHLIQLHRAIAAGDGRLIGRLNQALSTR
jgi:dihydroorotate dehydrogenase